MCNNKIAGGMDSMVSKGEYSEDHVSEGTVIFRPGVALSQRQVFYQVNVIHY